MPSASREFTSSSAFASVALVIGVLSCPSPASAEPQISALAKGRQNAPNLDAEVAWQKSPPKRLQGVWEALGASDNKGEAFSEFTTAKPIMVIMAEGWQLPKGSEEEGVQPYFKIGQLPDDEADAPTWLVLLQKQSQPLIVHAPKDSSLLVVRQFLVSQPSGDIAENARWVVSVRPVEPPRPQAHLKDSTPENAADARVSMVQEPAKVKPVGEGKEGTLAVEYLSPWNRSDAARMLELFTQHRWPAKRTLSPGLMVLKALPGASADFKAHDLIYRISDVWLRSENDMREALASLRAGVPVTVRVKRLQPNSKGDPTWMTNEFVVTPLSKKEAILAQQRESARMLRAAEEKRRADEVARQERLAAALKGPSYEYDGRFPRSSFRARLEETVLKSDMTSLQLERQLKLVLSRSGLTLNEVDWAEHIFKSEAPTSELTAEELAKYRAYLMLTAGGF